MGPPDLTAAIRAQLDALVDTLGGSWALVERRTESPLVVATTADLADDLRGPGQDRVVEDAARAGVVVHLGLGRDCHPAGRGERGRSILDRSRAPERVLVGTELPAGPPRSTEMALLEIVLRSLNAIIEAQRRAEVDQLKARRLELHATTDPLTGLLNRRGWDRLMTVEEDGCVRHELPAELVVIDLDGLKTVNDTYGHEAGDALIIRAATFIFSALRIHDSVARLGGDEFGVLAVGAPPGANPVSTRIEQALAEADIGASIGSANRAEAGDLPRAWRAADVRMYRMKQVHRRAMTTSGTVDSERLP